jgi:hypothetical protein
VRHERARPVRLSARSLAPPSPTGGLGQLSWLASTHQLI